MAASNPSATIKLVTDIEILTGSSWTPHIRLEVAELIRKYRFDQVSTALSGAMEKVQKLVDDSGNTELSEKIRLGKL